MNTLYVTDLDGTLLDAQSQVSHFSKAHLNALLARGVPITIATGRAAYTLSCVEGVHWTLPWITLGGAQLVDPVTREVLWEKPLQVQTVRRVLNCIQDNGMTPIVYAQDEQERQHCFICHPDTALTAYVSKQRANMDDRFCAVEDFEEIFHHKLFYLSAHGEMQALRAVCEQLADVDVHAYLYYGRSGECFVEVCSCSKGDGLRALAARLRPKCVVAFGDNGNDTALFTAADIGLAVGNAQADLRACADAVILSNTQDGVVREILRREQEADAGGTVL